MAYNFSTPGISSKKGNVFDDLNSPVSRPKEYTPELTQDFFNSLARPIEEQTRSNVGKARGEALRRGLEGDPFESLGVAKARTEGSNQLADLWSGISMQGAGMAREERVGRENREDTQAYGAEQSQLGRDWQSGENAANRSFSERMAQINYDNDVGLMKRKNRYDYQSELWNTGAGFLKGMIGGS